MSPALGLSLSSKLEAVPSTAVFPMTDQDLVIEPNRREVLCPEPRHKLNLFEVQAPPRGAVRISDVSAALLPFGDDPLNLTPSDHPGWVAKRHERDAAAHRAWTIDRQ